MRTVLGFKNDNDVVYVCFETRLNEPWTQLGHVVKAVPEVTNKRIKFSKRIPEDCDKYLLIDHFYNEVTVEETTKVRDAIRFLRYKETPTLGDLLKKYLAANES